MKSLETLELQQTGIPIPGLAALSSNLGLKRLYLGETEAASEELQTLQRVLPECLISWWPKKGE